jgi:hypothetical protein
MMAPMIIIGFLLPRLFIEHGSCGWAQALQPVRRCTHQHAYMLARRNAHFSVNDV